MPPGVRATGCVASLLFAATAVEVFAGRVPTPLSHPLPFLAFPFLAVPLFGWAWAQYRDVP